MFLLNPNSLSQARRSFYSNDKYNLMWWYLSQRDDVTVNDFTYNYIVHNDDILRAWCEDNFADKIAHTNREVVLSYHRMIDKMIQSRLWSPSSIRLWSNDISKPEQWIIAMALLNRRNISIVTLTNNSNIVYPQLNKFKGFQFTSEPDINIVSRYFHINTVPLYYII